MVEPLIRWLTASGKGHDIAFSGLKLASKWYADAGTLLTNSVEDMISLLERKKERKMVTTSFKNAQRVACTRGCADGPAMWGDSAP